MSIDNLDLKILYELDKSVRTPYSVIAKKAGVSKQTVQNRIDRLLEDNVITYFVTIINIAKFGAVPTQVYISLNNCTAEEKENFTQALINNPQIPQLAFCEGIYDAYFGVKGKNQHEIDQSLTTILTPFSNIVKTRKLIQFVDTRLFPRDFLIGGKRDISPHDKGFHTRHVTPAKIKEIDWMIMGMLCEDPRIPFAEIARRIEANAQTVIDRVKYLEKEDVIRGYMYLLNESMFIEYNVLLEMAASPELETKLFQYLANQPIVMFIVKSLGEFDYSLQVECRTPDQYRKFADDFKKQFAPHIRSFIPLAVTSFPKLNFLPKF